MRKLATFAVAVIAASSVVPAPASASPAPVTGTVVCTIVNAHILFSRGITPTPSVKNVRADGFALTDCDNSNVSGGKYPISRAYVWVRGRLPVGTTCDSAEANPVGKATMRVRFFHKPDPPAPNKTVANLNIKIASTTLTPGGFVLTSEPIRRGAFAGQTFTINATSYYTFSDCSSENNPIDGIKFFGNVSSP